MTRKEFYKSKQWEAFRQVVIDQHIDPDGYVHCASCGKPILQKYDLIIHHKQELSEDNVNDAMVSLNPDNVECVCFKCHNKIHDRFSAGHAASFSRSVQKHVYIVYGAPCAGKSSWVMGEALAEDLVVDLDSIWQMISINDRYIKPAALKAVAFMVYDELLDIIKYRTGKWHNAYVITGGALKGDRERLAQRIGADDLIHIDTPIEVCLQRLEERDMPADQKEQWKQFIVDHFQKFQSD